MVLIHVQPQGVWCVCPGSLCFCPEKFSSRPAQPKTREGKARLGGVGEEVSANAPGER